MLPFGGRLRSVDLTPLLPYMQDMYDRDRNSKFEQEMQNMKLAQMRQDMREKRNKAMADRAVEDAKRERAIFDARQGMPGYNQIPGELQTRMGTGYSQPSDVATMISAMSGITSADPTEVYRQTMQNSRQLADLVSRSAGPSAGGGGGMSRDDMINQLADVRGVGTGYMRDKPSDYPFLEQGAKEDLARDIAKIEAQGKVDAAKYRNANRGTGPTKPDYSLDPVQTEAVINTVDEKWGNMTAGERMQTDKQQLFREEMGRAMAEKQRRMQAQGRSAPVEGEVVVPGVGYQLPQQQEDAVVTPSGGGAIKSTDPQTGQPIYVGVGPLKGLPQDILEKFMALPESERNKFIAKLGG